MFFLILLVLMFLSLVVQHFIGPLPNLGARVLLMPIVMFYGALALPTWGMLAMAFAGGLMWDSLHVQILEGEVEIGLGWSIVLYAALGALMSGFRPLFQRGRWEIHCILSGICTSAIVLAEYLMISLRRQPVLFHFDPEIWWRIGGAGLAAMFLSPFFFFALNYVAYLVGYKMQPDRIQER
jgi:hypothetical protein